jgi:RNA polymerase sigma-70 factor (ECF subfamily)
MPENTSDAEKFAELIGSIEDRMIRSIGRILHAPDPAEDALQNALARIWEKLDAIVQHPNPSALVLKICIHASYDVLRTEKKHRGLQNAAGTMDSLAGADARPDRQMELSERRREVIRCVGELPEMQQAAIYLRYFESTSFREIADALGCEESTCRKHVELGRRKLSASLAHLVFNQEETSK